MFWSHFLKTPDLNTAIASCCDLTNPWMHLQIIYLSLLSQLQFSYTLKPFVWYHFLDLHKANNVFQKSVASEEHLILFRETYTCYIENLSSHFKFKMRKDFPFCDIENRDVISKNELLMRGKTPSIVKIKED